MRGGKHLRGHGANAVIVDEAAFLPESVISEAIAPMLADVGGTMILASTPGLRGGMLHKLFERGQDGKDLMVRSFHFRSVMNPHVDKDYVEGQRAEPKEGDPDDIFMIRYLHMIFRSHDK